MLLGPFEFAFAALCFCAALLWVQHRRFHERAVGVVSGYCATNGLQMLDGTVAFRGFRFERWPWHICRTFRFDYSLNGVDRHKGQLTLCGEHTQSFRVNPDHLAQNPMPSPQSTRQAEPSLLSRPRNSGDH